MKSNCWDVMKCGRQAGGPKTQELGVCPAATATALNGVHGGNNGGRACLALVGTLCGGQVQGTFAAKGQRCSACDFFRQATREEGAGLVDFKRLQAIMDKAA